MIAMADTKQDLIEQLFESVKIISQEQLKSLSFDVTVEATVIDASRAQDGIYTVSTGNANFLAYSTETEYKKDDAVMVTIPQGDYNKQKMIIGKQVDQTNTAMIYKSPFQQLVNVSNNLISESKSISMWANSAEKFNWEKNISNFWQSKAFQERYNQYEDTAEEVLRQSKTALIWDSNDENIPLNETRYTRLGIKAQFSTWLGEYNTAYGNYGLAIVLVFSNTDSSGKFGKTIIFDSDDFFGDVYNFETYYTQEALFDISEYVDYAIQQIQIYAYQRNNFRNINNERIYESEEVDNNEDFSEIQANIFIKDPYICLGMPTSDFNADVAEIITTSEKAYQKDELTETEVFDILQNELNALEEDEFFETIGIEKPVEEITKVQKQQYINNYLASLSTKEKNILKITKRNEKNKKILNIRWIHKDAEANTIHTILQNELPPDYHIYWYRYTLGAPSPDNLIGAHWERFYGCRDIPDEKEEYCLTFKEGSMEGDYSSDKDKATDYVEDIVFQPNINRASEKIRAVIVKREDDYTGTVSDRLVAMTQVIEFTNQTTVRDEATYIDANALSIKFEDEERGNYFLYNRADTILEDQSKKLRVLTAVFNQDEHDIYKKPLLTQPYTSIKWIFPYGNDTMIIPATSHDIGKAQSILELNADQIAKINETENFTITYNSTDQVYIYEFVQPDANAPIDSSIISVGYFIKNKLIRNANRNTITLEINKDGEIFTAQAQLVFGTAGTSGSDYTIVLRWANHENAYDINKSSMSGRAVLYNQSGEEVDVSNSEYIFDWYKINTQSTHGERDFSLQKESKSLYYPINNNVLNTINSSVDYMVSNELAQEADANDIAIYNLETKKFDNSYVYSTNSLMYQKMPAESKNIINFNALITKNEKYVPGRQEGSGNIVTQNGKRIFYYDNRKQYYEENNLTSGSNLNNYLAAKKQKKAFIKYNDTYIIDPWDEYQETETYYEPVYTSKRNYNSNISGLLSINGNSDGTFEINGTPNMGDLYILQVTLTKFGDYDLIARFPIPLKYSDSIHDGVQETKDFIIDYIDGPIDVRYSTSGETDFNKNPFSIFLRVLNDKLPQKNYETIKQGYHDTVDSVLGHWELIYDNNTNFDRNFLPILSESGEVNISDVVDLLEEPLNKAYTNAIKRENALLIALQLAEDRLGYNRRRVKQAMETELQYQESLRNVLEAEIHYLGSINSNIIKAYGSSYKDNSGNWNVLSQYQDTITNYYNTYASVLARNQRLINYGVSDAQSYYQYLSRQLKIFEEQTAEEKAQLKYQLNLIKTKEISVLQKEIDRLEIIRNSDLYFIKPLLSPSNIYFEDVPLYGVKFVLDYDLGTDNEGNVKNGKIEQVSNVKIPAGTVLWTQPIYVYQDNYPSTTLNKWNGKDIVTDENTGVISANGFSAGKKEIDNTFTGVVIGDWSRTDSDIALTKQTGVYGFNHGAMSYALKDDGTAFFGKDGSGRIYFDGNKAQIYSAKWTAAVNKNNGTYGQSHYGMFLDVDDGKIDIREHSNPQYKTTYIAPGEFKITGQGINDSGDDIAKTLFIIDKNNYYLQSSNYGTANYSQPNGRTKTGRGLRFDLKNNKLIGYDFELKAGHIETINGNSINKQIIIDSNAETYPFKIGRYFKIDWDGAITSSSGTIGGWKINSDSLTNSGGTVGLDADGFIYSGKFTENGSTTYNFKVDTSGKLTARQATIEGDITANTLTAITSGEIGGWKISSDSLTSKNNANVYLSVSSGIKLTDKFYVTTSGYLYAENATVSGTINASSGTFSNTIYCTGIISGGEISGSTISGGTISGSSISGGTISGGEISGSTISGGTVSGSTISGGTVSGSSISGGTMSIGSGNTSFGVNGDGKLSANGVDITGKITATSGKIGEWDIYSEYLQGGNIFLYNSTGIIDCSKIRVDLISETYDLLSGTRSEPDYWAITSNGTAYLGNIWIKYNNRWNQVLVDTNTGVLSINV